MQDRQNVARSIGEVVMEGANLEHAVAELCWSLMAGGGHPDEEVARVATENMQYDALKKTTLRLAQLSNQRDQLSQETLRTLTELLKKTVEPMNSRGALAHIVVFGSNGQHMGFRRKGADRFQEIDPIQLLELSGQLAQLASQVSMLHGDLKSEIGIPPR